MSEVTGVAHAAQEDSYIGEQPLVELHVVAGGELGIGPPPNPRPIGEATLRLAGEAEGPTPETEANQEVEPVRVLTAQGELLLKPLQGNARVLAEWFVLHPDVAVHPRELHHLIQGTTREATMKAFVRGIGKIREIDNMSSRLHHDGYPTVRRYWMKEIPGATRHVSPSLSPDSSGEADDQEGAEEPPELRQDELEILRDFQGDARLIAEWMLRNPCLEITPRDLWTELNEKHGCNMGQKSLWRGMVQIKRHPILGKHLHKKGHGMSWRYWNDYNGRLYTTLLADEDGAEPSIPYLDRELEMLELMRTHPDMRFATVELGCFVSDGGRLTYSMAVTRFLRKVARDPEYKGRLYYTGGPKDRKYWLTKADSERKIERPELAAAAHDLLQTNKRIAAIEKLPEYQRRVDEYLRDGKWENAALCGGVEPEMFFAERQIDVLLGSWTCSQCVVRDECLEAGISERHGIRGGLTREERLEVIQERRQKGGIAARLLIEQIRQRHVDEVLSILDAAPAEN